MAAATVDQILDALNDYSDFEELGSAARARSFITAARRFLALPSTSADQGSSMGYTPDMVRREMEVARAFVQANPSPSSADNSRVRFLVASEGFRR